MKARTQGEDEKLMRLTTNHFGPKLGATREDESFADAASSIWRIFPRIRIAALVSLKRQTDRQTDKETTQNMAVYNPMYHHIYFWRHIPIQKLPSKIKILQYHSA